VRADSLSATTQLIEWDLAGVDSRCNNAPDGFYCGLHIHPGMSCDSHLLTDTYDGLHRDDWDSQSITNDGVWNVPNFGSSRYTTTGTVAATGSHTITSGQEISGLVGHAFVVHSWDMSTAPYGGERLGCGILTEDGAGGLIASTWVDYPGDTNPGGYNVQGTVTVTPGTEPLTQDIAWDLTGVDGRCNNWAGGSGGPHCGLHIHPGVSCDSHMLVDSFNGLHRDEWVVSSASDDGVWQVNPGSNFMGSSYSTTGTITASGSFELQSGLNLSTLVGHAFVVHSYNMQPSYGSYGGQRIACGTLQSDFSLTMDTGSPDWGATDLGAVDAATVHTQSYLLLLAITALAMLK